MKICVLVLLPCGCCSYWHLESFGLRGRCNNLWKVLYDKVLCTAISLWTSTAEDNITEGSSETRVYIGFLYVYFNMTKLIKYFYNVQAIQVTVSKVTFGLQSVLASEILKSLFPKVQNPNCLYLMWYQITLHHIKCIKIATCCLGGLRLTSLPGDSDWNCHLILRSHCRQIQGRYINVGQGHFIFSILSNLLLIDNCIAWAPDSIVKVCTQG